MGRTGWDMPAEPRFISSDLSDALLAQKGSPRTMRRCGRKNSPSSKDPLRDVRTESLDEIPWRKRSVRDLRDFTEEFIERGIHAEYCSWRDQYLRWRAGGEKGAKGENVETTHLQNRDPNFSHWYRTVSDFTFRRTCTYWIGVFFVEGCLFFLWQPFFDFMVPSAPKRMSWFMSKLPLLTGTTVFGSGIYLGYLELINMDTDVNDGHVNLLWCDWRRLLELLRDEDCEEARFHSRWMRPLSSILGWAIYLVGACLFQAANTASMFSDSLTAEQTTYICEWPLVFGGFCFLLGGVCEVIQNEIWATPPVTYAWWSSILNFFGGICFWLCACPNMVGEYTTSIGVVGTLAFLVTAVLSLCMWRGEQFGLSLISVLNRVHRDEGTQIAVRIDSVNGVSQIRHTEPDIGSRKDLVLQDMASVVSPALSPSGLAFVVMCVVCTMIQLLDTYLIFAVPWEFESSNRTVKRRIFMAVLGGVANVIAIHMVLLFNSACCRTPKDEPFRSLTHMMRFLLLIMTLRSTMSLELVIEDERVWLPPSISWPNVSSVF
eukprot:TRINITY_DN6315_c0_g1_i3.p1 TRINITY_DN6315_c0_g1~~TRINITY_DN6315_c0_g1_i3.p1  ORF type:complete len:545 (-),score=64.97 TRINITY_DN6315_c0_g1_i3:34-1668(-)